MVYRNWRQWWCKKEGNKVTEPKEVLNIGFLSHFPFPKTLFPSFLHQHCLQFLYPTNFLVRECFSLLVDIERVRSDQYTSLGYAQLKELQEGAIRCFFRGNDVLPKGFDVLRTVA